MATLTVQLANQGQNILELTFDQSSRRIIEGLPNDTKYWRDFEVCNADGDLRSGAFLRLRPRVSNAARKKLPELAASQIITLRYPILRVILNSISA